MIYWLACSLAVVAVSWPGLTRYYGYPKQDWREAAAFVQENLQTGDRIIGGMNAASTSLRHYLRRNPASVKATILKNIRTSEQMEGGTGSTGTYLVRSRLENEYSPRPPGHGREQLQLSNGATRR